MKRITAFIIIVSVILCTASCKYIPDIEIGLNDTSSGFVWSEPEYEVIEPELNEDGEPLVILNYENTPGDMYYRSLLPIRGRQVYDMVSDALASLEYSVTVPKITGDTLKNIMQSYILDHPETFYWQGEYSYTVFHDDTLRIDFKYLLTADDIKDYRKQINKATEEYLSLITADMTQLEAETIIHDALIRSLTYTADADNALPESFNIFGALVNDSAVCAGYAEAFKYLCNKVGIPVISVIGTAQSDTVESHQWNIVTINDISFHVDVTWDDPVFDDGAEMLTYQYFNVNDSEIFKTHTATSEFKIPVCSTSEYGYCEKNGLVITDLDDTFDILVEAIVYTVETKKDYCNEIYDVTLKVDTQACLYEDACDIIEDEFSAAIDEASKVADMGFTNWELTYMMDEDICPYAAFCITKG